MGRYLGGDLDYKFWFGVQPSDDILLYGHQEERINGYVNYEDLDKIIEQVKGYKDEFKEKFGITYDEFMKKIKDKGYLSSSSDEETNADKWGEMSSLASRIDLGDKVIKYLNDTKEDMYFDTEI